MLLLTNLFWERNPHFGTLTLITEPRAEGYQTQNPFDQLPHYVPILNRGNLRMKLRRRWNFFLRPLIAFPEGWYLNGPIWSDLPPFDSLQGCVSRSPDHSFGICVFPFPSTCCRKLNFSTASSPAISTIFRLPLLKSPTMCSQVLELDRSWQGGGSDLHHPKAQ